MSTDDKSKVNETIYKISNDTFLFFYSAEWCGPCSRIKPYVNKYLQNYTYTNNTIEKTFFKENINNFIPFFKFVSTDKKTSIQTSDHDILKTFLINNGVIFKESLELDDDF